MLGNSPEGLVEVEVHCVKELAELGLVQSVLVSIAGKQGQHALVTGTSRPPLKSYPLFTTLDNIANQSERRNDETGVKPERA